MPENENTCPIDLVKEVLKTGKVQSFYQPIVSVQKKTIIGFEAFARGIAAGENQVIKPKDLFNACHDKDTQMDIDRACRDAALDQFQNIYKTHKNVLLFLNINLGAFSEHNVQKDYLLTKTLEHGYAPHHIVIEFDRDMIRPEFPFNLLEYYRANGFKFCIDEITTSDLGLDKLFMIKPDFVKVSRSLFTEVEGHTHKLDMLKSLCKVAEDLGCAVVGKSVEEESEAFTLLENGIIHQQGFFFTKTKNDDAKKDSLEIFKEKIHNVHNRYRQRMTQSIKSKKDMFESYHKLGSKIMYRLESATSKEFPELCKRICMSIKEVAGIFVLDENGMQITSRFIKLEAQDGTNTLKETEQREDHSIKDYVLYLTMGFEKFVTPSFTSQFTKKKHTIISRRFFNNEGRPYILCIELPYTAN